MNLKLLLIEDNKKLILDEDIWFLASEKEKNLARLFRTQRGLFAFDRKNVFLGWLNFKDNFLGVIVKKNDFFYDRFLGLKIEDNFLGIDLEFIEFGVVVLSMREFQNLFW
jgi:hypothetical protein